MRAFRSTKCCLRSGSLLSDNTEQRFFVETLIWRNPLAEMVKDMVVMFPEKGIEKGVIVEAWSCTDFSEITSFHIVLQEVES